MSAGEPVEMAPETKVGLLVGLAFIICFAVILSNRGGEEPLVSAEPFLPSSPSTVPQPTRDLRARSASHRIDRPIDDRAQRHPREAAPSSGSGIDFEAEGESSVGDDAQQFDRFAEPERSSQLADANSLVPQMAATNEHWGAERESRADARRVEAPNPHEVANTRADSVPPQHQQSSNRTKTYTVASGDTLSAIANAHYGSRAKRIVDAIFDANRDQLSNPNQIRVGMKLALPTLADAKPDRRDIAQDHQSAPPTATNQGSGFRWYQVKKSDRYVSIAREQLGDGARWREIFALNQDKFPDPNRIREGVRIKIPLGGSRD